MDLNASGPLKVNFFKKEDVKFILKLPEPWIWYSPLCEPVQWKDGSARTLFSHAIKKHR